MLVAEADGSFGASVSFPYFSVAFVDILCESRVVLQAFGGAISVMVGSIVWCQIGVGKSNAASLDTFCISCHVNLTNISTSESIALSNASGTQPAVLLLLLIFACVT